jgi:hypothetical protein
MIFALERRSTLPAPSDEFGTRDLGVHDAHLRASEFYIVKASSESKAKKAILEKLGKPEDDAQEYELTDGTLETTTVTDYLENGDHLDEVYTSDGECISAEELLKQRGSIVIKYES